MGHRPQALEATGLQDATHRGLVRVRCALGWLSLREPWARRERALKQKKHLGGEAPVLSYGFLLFRASSEYGAGYAYAQNNPSLGFVFLIAVLKWFEAPRRAVWHR